MSIYNNKVQINKFDNKLIIDAVSTLIHLFYDLPLIYGFLNDSIEPWVIPSNFAESQAPAIVLPIDDPTVSQCLTDGPINEKFHSQEYAVWEKSLYIYPKIVIEKRVELADGNKTKFGLVSK